CCASFTTTNRLARRSRTWRYSIADGRLATLSRVCQDRRMKHFLVACLFPMLLNAQNLDLTKELGKTVLYGDVALSPDGTHVAWVQSTAATTSQQTFIQTTAEGGSPIAVNLGSTGDRTDAGLAWSPDSKTLVVFGSAG